MVTYLALSKHKYENHSISLGKSSIDIYRWWVFYICMNSILLFSGELQSKFSHVTYCHCGHSNGVFWKLLRSRKREAPHFHWFPIERRPRVRPLKEVPPSSETPTRENRIYMWRLGKNPRTSQLYAQTMIE